MKFCDNCNKALEDDACFCSNCGTPVLKVTVCPHCGNPLDHSFVYCPNCGTALVKEKKIVSVKSSKKNISKYFFAGGASIIMLSVIVLFFVFFTGQKQPNDFLYLKNGEIYYHNLSCQNSLKLTTQFSDYRGKDGNDNITTSFLLSQYFTKSKNQKFLFFPGQVTDINSKIFSLFFQDIYNSAQIPIKIDSEVTYYTVDKTASSVTYLKGEKQELFRYCPINDTKEKLDSNVDSSLCIR